jgi:hypothetical protein
MTERNLQLAATTSPNSVWSYEYSSGFTAPGGAGAPLQRISIHIHTHIPQVAPHNGILQEVEFLWRADRPSAQIANSGALTREKN